MGGCVRVLTPPGRGAVAVIELTADSPETALILLNQHFRCFSGCRSPDTADVGRVLYGRWNDEDLILVRTDQCTWEIHCHGGTAAVAAIVNSLNVCPVADGTVPLADAPPPQAYSAAEPPPAAVIAREVRQLLLQAGNRRCAAHLLAQRTDTLSSLLQQIAECESPGRRRQLAMDMLQWLPFTQQLVTPSRVLMLGAPNVGKSSLVNALIGFERALVFDQPGTTRDLIDVPVTIAGWSFVFVDSAGMRAEADNEIEQQGIHAAKQVAEKCNICILVVDATERGPSLNWMAPLRIPTVLVVNKVDLVRDRGLRAMQTDSCINVPEFVRTLNRMAVSAKTGQGLPALSRWLLSTHVRNEPVVGTPLPVPGSVATWLLAVVSEMEES